MGSVWGCSEKVPTATGKSLENDRGRVAIGVFWSQWHVEGEVGDKQK
jgi:hypothetical protein